MAYRESLRWILRIRHVFTSLIIILLSVFLLSPGAYQSEYDLPIFIVCAVVPCIHFGAYCGAMPRDRPDWAYPKPKEDYVDEVHVGHIMLYALLALAHFIVGIIGFAGNYNRDIVAVSQAIATLFCYIELSYWSHIRTNDWFMRYTTGLLYIYIIVALIASFFVDHFYSDIPIIIAIVFFGIWTLVLGLIDRVRIWNLCENINSVCKPCTVWCGRNISTISSSMTKTTDTEDDPYLPITFSTVILFVSGTADMTTDLWYAFTTDFESPILLIFCWAFIGLQLIPQLVIGIQGILLLLSTKKLIPWSMLLWTWSKYAEHSNFKKSDLFKLIAWFFLSLLIVFLFVVWMLVITPLWIVLVSSLYLVASVTKLVSIESVPIMISKLLVFDSNGDDEGEATESSSGWRGKLKVKKSVFNGMVLIETFTESIPQIIITSINTYLSAEGFTDIGIATVSVSGFVLLNTIYKIVYNVFVEKRKDIAEWEL